MLPVGLIWCRVLVNQERMFFLCVMWEACVLVQLLALQEDSAVGWITKESSINLWQGKAFCHLQSIRTPLEARVASH